MLTGLAMAAIAKTRIRSIILMKYRFQDYHEERELDVFCAL